MESPGRCGSMKTWKGSCGAHMISNNSRSGSRLATLKLIRLSVLKAVYRGPPLDEFWACRHARILPPHHGCRMHHLYRKRTPLRMQQKGPPCQGDLASIAGPLRRPPSPLAALRLGFPLPSQSYPPSLHNSQDCR